MADDEFEVTVTAGVLRRERESSTTMPHRWTDRGVSIEAPFTGAHLLHLAVAGCVLNDLYREARAMGIQLDGVRVRARGGFDTTSWSSTGVAYDVELESSATAGDLERLVAVVDDVAEIPRALRSATTVRRQPLE